MQHHSLLSRILCISCASFALVGCSYFDTGETVSLEAAKPTMPETAVYTPQPVDLAGVVYENTRGSVELFDLGSPVYESASVWQDTSVSSFHAVDVAPVPVVPVQRGYAAVPAGIVSGDPSVEIFPFDDLSVQPMSAQMVVPVAASADVPDYVRLGAGDGDKVIVYFDHDSAILTQKALEEISGVAEAFNAASGRTLSVEGHASVRANYNDAAHRKIVNLKISMDRAFAVARDLVAKGVPADVIRVTAWGEALPAQNLDGKTPEEAARRVEISR